MREHNLEGGRPPRDWDDPTDRDRLISELVDDANELVWAAENLELTDVQADAIALLALVAGQDVEPGDRPGRWRIAQRTAPVRVISTVDPEARHAHKTRAAYRDGYKAHVAAEPDTGLVTSCDIGPGDVGDTDAAPDLLADEPAGTEVLDDSAYSSGEFRAHLEDRDMGAVIEPRPLQAATPGGFTLDDFTLDDFTVDRHASTLTCLEAITVTISPVRRRPLRHPLPGLSGPVPLHQRQGRSGDRVAPHHDLLAAARRQAETDAFADSSRQHRPMIERTIAWLVRESHRRLRFRGAEANRLTWSRRCAAINLKRLLTLGLTYNSGWTIKPTA